eukprot:2348264-Prymnesium_polylepis.1
MGFGDVFTFLVRQSRHGKTPREAEWPKGSALARIVGVARRKGPVTLYDLIRACPRHFIERFARSELRIVHNHERALSGDAMQVAKVILHIPIVVGAIQEDNIARLVERWRLATH